MAEFERREGDVLAWRDGAAGRIRLNRPKALNALNYGMVETIRTALDHWAEDSSVSCIVLDGDGEKAFCAGGDIRFMYDTGRQDPEPGRKFWRDEYCVNLLISRYPKPIVTLMDGITMGGGVGLASHASHRVVTERSTVAMPEAAIGFLPDVGGTHLLAHTPGKTGLYLATTSARMNAADSIHAGFADAYIPSDAIESLAQRLANGEHPDDILTALAQLPDGGSLADRQTTIETLFGGPTMLDCVLSVESLAATGDEWAGKTASALRHNSPFSLAAIFYALDQARSMDLEHCLKMEYRFSHRVLAHDDYYEGVRAVIVDKDRNPKWNPARLEDVNKNDVKAMFANLGPNEWSFS